MATGATPVLAAIHPRVFGIRDMEVCLRSETLIIPGATYLPCGNVSFMLYTEQFYCHHKVMCVVSMQGGTCGTSLIQDAIGASWSHDTPSRCSNAC